TVAEISELIGSSITDSIPSASLGFPALDDIQLTDVKLVLASTPSVRMIALGATATWAIGRTFPIFDGLIAFNDMFVSFTYTPAGYARPDGSTWYVTGSVGASASISGGQLVAAFDLPDVSFSCELADDTTIDIRQLVLAAAGDTIQMPKIDCTQLKVFGDWSTQFYRFQATVTSDWTFHIGSTPFSLTEISMDIGKDPSAFTGEVAAKFSIAGADLYGRASYTTETGGWEFQMGTLEPVHVSLTDLVKAVASYFGVQVPNTAPTLYLHAINFFFNTATHEFIFQCQATLDVSGAETVFGVGIEKTTDSIVFAGYLWVGESYFEVDFSSDQKTTMTALWQETTEQAYLQFSDIASMLHLPSPTLPDGLDLNLKSASLSYGFGDGRLIVSAESATYGKAIFVAQPAQPFSTVYYAALTIDHPIDISELPVLDSLLGPDQTAAIDTLQVIVSSSNITADEAKLVNDDIPAGYPKLPATGTKGALGLSAVITFGGTKYPVSLGISDVQRNGGKSTAGDSIVGPQSGTNAGSVTSTPPAQSDGTMWFNIQKSFGPVAFDKVGVRYSDSVLWVALNASLKVGGLTVSLIGASIGSPITTFDPRFALQGLGIDFKKPPLEIGGGFIHTRPSSGDIANEYDGSVIVKTSQFSLVAYGSYVELKNGNPSMFLFAQLHGKFGGPPIFFVTGILGGFGYNSQVRLPTPAEVFQFPLIAGLSDPSRVGGTNATPVQALTAMTGGVDPWVYPQLGQNWIAAGVTFTSYQLVNSVALLLVEFGSDLTISLMGLSTATFPAGPATPRPYAQVQLQLLALLQPSQGFFGIAANLTRNSYLLDPACVLTGGFAFYFWFEPTDPQAENHAGDFVITLGGYNPNFDKPAHYPTAPRVAFSWSYDSTLSINGGAYFALTPSTIQAGGSLALNFHDGAFNAWLTAHADLIVWFKPFYFILDVGVSVGASYTMNLLFTSVTLSVELSADLTLWGPPTSGKATIHWWVISFTVHFGPTDEPSRPQPLSQWADFATLLPPAPDVVKITALTGLAAQQVPNEPSQSGMPWIVRNNNFSMVTRSAIPLQSLTFGSYAATGDALFVRPMQQGGAASQAISIYLDGSEIDYIGWTAEPQTVGVAKALWGAGDGSRLDPASEQLVPNQLTGFVIYAPQPALGPTPGVIPVDQNLRYDPLSPDGITAITSAASPTGDIPVAGRNAILTIQNEIATIAVMPRNELYAALAALGVDPLTNGAMTTFAAEAGELFVAQPLLVPAA
ncbi:MAG TPA: DUF6603 domain-containing protein, partial [Thermoanaerobaculia bacterium]